VLAFAVFRIFQESWVFVLGYSGVFGGVLLAALLWFLPNSRFAARLRLHTRIGRSASDEASVEPGRYRERADLVGKSGVALTDLRPAGTARFGDDRVDVVTQGDFIAHGTTIQVLHVEGNRVTVREASAEAQASDDPANAAI